MTEAGTRALDDFCRKLQAVIDSIPERKKDMYGRIGSRVQKEVRREIGLSINDTGGKVAGWQERYVGSGGGYAAVRPTNTSVGRQSPGAITNYLESGHKIRGSEKRARAFRFYATVRGRVKTIALEEAEDFAREMKEALS